MTASTTTETDTATYAISKKQNREIAALHHVASRDSTRETVRGVKITYSDEALTFTVTNSYMLAERTYAISDGRSNDRIRIERLSGNGQGDVVVNAVALRDALNTIKTASLATFSVGIHGVTVSANNASITVPPISGEYPDADKVGRCNPPTDPYESEYMALNARYLWDLSRSTGRSSKDMDLGPLVLRGSTKLQPVHITMSGETGWRGLLMPVRF